MKIIPRLLVPCDPTARGYHTQDTVRMCRDSDHVQWKLINTHRNKPAFHTWDS